MNNSTNSRILNWLAAARKKGKKGEETRGKSAPVPRQQNWRRNEAQKDEKKAARL
jgi:hypothetical protein